VEKAPLECTKLPGKALPIYAPSVLVVCGRPLPLLAKPMVARWKTRTSAHVIWPRTVSRPSGFHFLLTRSIASATVYSPLS